MVGWNFSGSSIRFDPFIFASRFKVTAGYLFFVGLVRAFVMVLILSLASALLARRVAIFLSYLDLFGIVFDLLWLLFVDQVFNPP